MCASDTGIKPYPYLNLILYSIAIILGIISGMLDIPLLNQIAENISTITIKIFKCLSLPLISLSLIATITSFQSNERMKRISQKAILYTFSTTVLAATVACLLYLLIKPDVTVAVVDSAEVANATSYFKHLAKMIPANIFEPYLEHNVFGVLIISIIGGLAIKAIPNTTQRETLANFAASMHSIFIVLTKYVIKMIPIALYGFITMTFVEFKQDNNIAGIGKYLLVVLLANLVQGLIILPLWLKFKSINIGSTLKGALPALSLAFFSKSSASTLPLTIECAENRLGIHPEIARYVLPLCTTINMNGCAAFIFTEVTP